MAAVIFHEPVFATIVESGDKLYFYEVLTTTDLTVYLDAALTTPATQPVVADSAGRFAPIYLNPSANNPKVVLTDATGVQKWALPEYPIEDSAKLQQDLSQAGLDIDSLDGRMATAESNIGTLQTESADYAARITSLEGAGTDLGNIGNGARVRRATTQSIPTNGANVIFDTTDFDDASIVSASVITIPAGVSRVIVTAGAQLQMTGAGVASAAITKNGAGYSGKPIEGTHIADAPVTLGFNLSTGMLNVSGGDTFELNVSHGQVAGQTLSAGAWMNVVILK